MIGVRDRLPHLGGLGAGIAYRARRLLGLVGSGDAVSDPSAALFRGIRGRLILWYSGVLATALLLSSIALYLGVRQSLLGPVHQGLQQDAEILSDTWQTAAADFPSLPPSCPLDHFDHTETLFVCFDTRGQVLDASRIAGAVPSFGAPSLVRAALRNGQAQDTVGTGGPGAFSTIQRYAVAVPAHNHHTTLGVIQVGIPIGSQLAALDTLLHLLLTFGVLTLLFAAIGGLFLAHRALLPARIAHARQRDFVADASHELRTPLTMLRSNVEVVLRGRERLQPEDVALLEDTVMEAKHLASLANNMLDLARLDVGGMHLEQEVVDLDQLVEEVVRWGGSLAAEHGLTLQVERSGSVLVVGDRSLLEQAVLILLENGIKYNRAGGEVTLHPWLADGQARLEVRDTGIGIPNEHLSHLGERFYRADKARSRESGGAGLGLSIVRGIVLRHGGSLHFASDLGKGTTTTLSLPAARAHGGSRA